MTNNMTYVHAEILFVIVMMLFTVVTKHYKQYKQGKFQGTKRFLEKKKTEYCV